MLHPAGVPIKPLATIPVTDSPAGQASKPALDRRTSLANLFGARLLVWAMFCYHKDLMSCTAMLLRMGPSGGR